MVFPQALEERARARDAGAPLPGVVGEAAAQRDLVTADLLQVRVDVRRRVRRHMALPLDEVEGAAEAQVHVAEAERPAKARARGVRRVGLAAGCDRERDRTAVDVERVRDRVPEHEA